MTACCLKRLIYLPFAFLLHLNLKAQISFSQFYASPLLVNPANTGRFNQDYRIGGGYRNEKNPLSQTYSVKSFFLDSKILNSMTNNDCFGIGILGLNEQSFDEGIKNTYLSLSMAYQKAIDDIGKQQIGLGFQTTFAYKHYSP